LAAFEDERAQVACGWPGTWRSANEQVCLGCLVDSSHGREMVRGLIMNNAAFAIAFLLQKIEGVQCLCRLSEGVVVGSGLVQRPPQLIPSEVEHPSPWMLQGHDQHYFV